MTEQDRRQNELNLAREVAWIERVVSQATEAKMHGELHVHMKEGRIMKITKITTYLPPTRK